MTAKDIKSLGREKKASSRLKSQPLPPTISRSALMVDGTDALVRRITHLHFVLSGLLEQIRGGFASLIGVSTFQYVLMQALGRLPTDAEWTVRSVAREMRMTDAYVSTEISDLVQKGLLEKVTNPEDRRVSFLTLTPEGFNSLASIAPVQQAVNDTLYGHLEKESAVSYASELDVLLTQAEAAIAVLDDISSKQRMTALKQMPRASRRRG